MEECIIIIASNGAEVIDSTPEARARIAAMEYAERKNRRNYKGKTAIKKKYSKNPLWRLVAFCGIV